MIQSLSISEWKFRQINWAESVWIAALYFLAARVGQLFAIEPGNVTPVWPPSGFMLALALFLGPRIWPGVFLGAFIGNAWAYFTLSSVSTSMAAISAGMLNGVGDVISTVVAARFIIHFSGTDRPFHSIKEFLWYILFGVFLGPAISALFGVTGLLIFKFLPAENYPFTLYTWFVGDGVGALIFGPLLLSWLHPLLRTKRSFFPVLVILIAISMVLTAVIFELVHFPKWLNYAGAIGFPIVLTLALNYSQRTMFTIQAIVSVIAIYATSINLGPFAGHSPNQSLIELQIFIAIFSFTLYSLAVMASQRQAMEIEISEQKTQLEKLYRLDALTGLWNRYRIKEFLQHELTRFNREQTPFGVIMIDIDDFKAINDTFGHLIGDKILVSLSQLIKERIRENDLFGRWGGEEFIIIASATNKESLCILADNIRELVASHDFELNRKITISLGATISCTDDTELKILDRVDDALYQSKNKQKNKLTFIDEK